MNDKGFRQSSCRTACCFVMARVPSLEMEWVVLQLVNHLNLEWFGKGHFGREGSYRSFSSFAFCFPHHKPMVCVLLSHRNGTVESQRQFRQEYWISVRSHTITAYVVPRFCRHTAKSWQNKHNKEHKHTQTHSSTSSDHESSDRKKAKAVTGKKAKYISRTDTTVFVSRTSYRISRLTEVRQERRFFSFPSSLRPYRCRRSSLLFVVIGRRCWCWRCSDTLPASRR